MNPPFTLDTNHERRIPDAPNPMFAAFGIDAFDQKAMGKALKQLAKGTVYHGNAGGASIFLELADRKLTMNGMLALVMPLALLTGSSWEKSRVRLAEAYDDLLLVSISGGDGTALSFSADTEMGECLVVGRRTGRRQSRAKFVILNQRADYPLYGAMIAQQIRKTIASGSIKTLEDGPSGGSLLKFGNDNLGQMIDAPLPTSGSWKLARIVDLSLAQSAYQLVKNNRIWLPAQQIADIVDIPMVRVLDIGEVGPYSLDISKRNNDGSIRGPFERRELQSQGVPTYPILWAHDADRERTMQFEADCEGIPFATDSDQERAIVDGKVERVYATASHCHSNVDFRFNSQSTAMQFTSRKTIGGRAWLSIQLCSSDLEKGLVLWANTTLGLFMYWWHSSKQQPGRGSIPKVALQTLPILDITALSAKQLQHATQLFDEICELPLKPIHELDKDENRKLLDRRFYGEVLGLPESLLADGGPLDILRQKLCREPSIRGSKK